MANDKVLLRKPRPLRLRYREPFSESGFEIEYVIHDFLLVHVLGQPKSNLAQDGAMTSQQFDLAITSRSPPRKVPVA